MKKLNEWVCTDADNDQWGRQLSETKFEFKEKNHFAEFDQDEADEYIEFEVDLNQYFDEQIAELVSPYYGSLNELKEICGDDWQWIMAECIFEQESGQY